jgi:hypothetical protein
MHLHLATVILALPSIDAKYIHLLLQFLRTQNQKSKEYKPFFQTFVGR